jgi:O-antigen/teichoic acid export membrane protein
MTQDKGWGWDIRIGLFVTVVVTIVARSFQDFYGLRLIIDQTHSAFMRPQLVAQVARLLALATTRAAGLLTAVLASLLSSLLAVIPAIQYRRQTGRIHARGYPEHERAIVSYALPLAPMLLYTAVQSQLPVFLASWFGSTRAIAEIGALSRLGQIYALVGIVNFMIIAPNAARAPRDGLERLLLLSIGAAVAFAGLTALCGIVAPGVFVALLGSDYESLKPEVGLYLVGAGLSFVSSVAFAFATARGYLYWWLTGLLIFGVLAVQTVGALSLDLSLVSNIVILLIVTGAAQLLIALVGLWFGLINGARPTRGLGGINLGPGSEL